ncbi:hypothetical protein J6590_024515 [Homalodisca vitripennis]|nr:hypothetical protein J6590_024515 [Homalodisca vitripennis]
MYVYRQLDADGIKLNDPNAIALQFNKFFSSVASSLDADCELELDTVNTHTSASSMVLAPVCEDEVGHTVKSFSVKTSNDINSISMWLLTIFWKNTKFGQKIKT